MRLGSAFNIVGAMGCLGTLLSCVHRKTRDPKLRQEKGNIHSRSRGTSNGPN